MKTITMNEFIVGYRNVVSNRISRISVRTVHIKPVRLCIQLFLQCAVLSEKLQRQQLF